MAYVGNGQTNIPVLVWFIPAKPINQGALRREPFINLQCHHVSFSVCNGCEPIYIAEKPFCPQTNALNAGIFCDRSAPRAGLACPPRGLDGWKRWMADKRKRGREREGGRDGWMDGIGRDAVGGWLGGWMGGSVGCNDTWDGGMDEMAHTHTHTHGEERRRKSTSW